MKIEFKQSFIERFERQLRFIAHDSPKNAAQFKIDMFKHIKSLPTSPLKCRKSIYFSDETIRDLIFKGYTIVYRIKHDKIEVFGFTKYQENSVD